MDQRSPEWFAARVGRVTGSNVGAILGIDPYRDANDVMRAMVRSYHKAESEFKGNVATEWGVANEDNAQFDYTIFTGNEVIECSFYTHDDWLGASPDGLVGLDKVLEIKCPFGKRNDAPPVFKTLEEQPHYYAQMQIEMYCTDRFKCDFWQWTPNGEQLIELERNEEWLAVNLPELKKFYQRYLTERDNPDHLEPERRTIDNVGANVLVHEYEDLCEMADKLKARKQEVFDQLVKLAGDKSALICGRKLTKVERKGSVKYAEIVKTELPHLDLDLHRGKPSTSWRFT